MGNNSRRRKRLLVERNGKWQKSVAQYMEEQGMKFISNEALPITHNKIKNNLKNK